MSLTKQELFTKFLSQIKLTDKQDETPFKEAAINQVDVHEKSGRWTFHLDVPGILPFSLFSEMEKHAQLAFADICRVDFVIRAEHAELTNRNLGDYWSWVLKNSDLNAGLISQLENSKAPEVRNNQVVLEVQNEVLKNLLDNKMAGSIEAAYFKAGFPKFTLQTTVDNSSETQAKIAELKKKNEERDRQLAQKAVTALKEKPKRDPSHANGSGKGTGGIGRKINPDLDVTKMADIQDEERSVVVNGYVFDKQLRQLRSGRQLLILKITDYSSSIVVKKFSKNEAEEQAFAGLNEGDWIKAKGSVQEDNYTRELTLNAFDINKVHHQERQDKAKEGEKRVELHLHSTMSQMDATNSISDYVKRAGNWKMPALAVTDTDDVQAFPDAYNSSKKTNLKMLYGMEANVVDDGQPIAYNDKHVPLKDATYVVFDVETTGLSAIYDKVIELSAVKMKGNKVLDQFEQFIDPGFPLSETTTNLTSITTDMVKGSKSEKEVFSEFKDFMGDAIVVGHNVTFDVGFMNTGYKRHGMSEIKNPIIDTLTLARFLYPNLKSYRLNTLAKRFDVSLEHHHRAIYDAESTGHLNYLFLSDAEKNYGIQYHDQLNNHMEEHDAYKHARPFHAVLMAQTQEGLKNLFKLVSKAHIDYYYRVPRIPRSQLNKLRKGILVGSADSSGEVFTAMMQKGKAEALKKAKYYDYLEVQPPHAYQPLIDQGLIADQAKLHEIINNMYDLAKELDIPLVATGDVHYMDPHDAIYRKILVHSQGGANPLNRSEMPDVHFETTDEMLDEFKFMGDDKAHEIVVDNTQKIANEIEDVHPLKDKLYTPKMAGSEEEIRKRTMDTARKLYGDPLPEIVSKRLDKELKSIIGNGFSVIYLIAQRLVAKSNKDGYLVGSRGSVGSSLVATMTGITEVNPLPPHYRCPNCQYSEFFTDGSVASGYDLPDKKCPKCGTLMVGDGQNIPFETFLGFKGNKVPDIDLNFSGDYQPIAHNYTKVLFGEKNVYRAGTIGTVADKTAYGYVKAYERDLEKHFRNAEIDRLSKGATGVKRTTGQHPAGIIVVPNDMDIYDFTPIQYPAEDHSAAWKTTHFDFHSIHDNILKIDILGHDDPTMIRMLQDLSGVEPTTIPMNDKGVLSLFTSPKILGVTSDQIGSKTGTLGLPEFGTRFVRGMLEETKPKSFADLLQISGLSHGTDVWLGNAEELIKDGKATISNVIGCRDNIMTDLINYGMNSESAFQIMESVRHGRGLTDEWKSEMKKANVPNWYMESCEKIKYMFPRAHAAAYVLMALRVAYFKVYFPLVYYAAYFSVRADDFDVVAMAKGKEAVKTAMKEITDKGMDASVKEKNLLTVLEIANEMLERGFEFEMVDINRSDASQWLMDGKKLIAPFRAIPGLGLNVAKQIIAAREDKPFLSKEDLAKRGKVSKTVMEFMDQNGVLNGLPDENQLSLF